ncbi:MAG: hypothetical protein ACJAWY_000345 [Sphingomonas echinoides]|jgi:hypothetical protein
MLEASGHVTDDLIRNAARRHPGGDQLLILIGLRFLGPGVGRQDQIRRLPARCELDKQL